MWRAPGKIVLLVFFNPLFITSHQPNDFVIGHASFYFNNHLFIYEGTKVVHDTIQSLISQHPKRLQILPHEDDTSEQLIFQKRPSVSAGVSWTLFYLYLGFLLKSSTSYQIEPYFPFKLPIVFQSRCYYDNIDKCYSSMTRDTIGLNFKRTRTRCVFILVCSMNFFHVLFFRCSFWNRSRQFNPFKARPNGSKSVVVIVLLFVLYYR